MYIYLLSEIGGNNQRSWSQSGNRFWCRFVFVPCVRACVRAKLCGCVRQVSPTLVARMERFPPPARICHFICWQPFRWF